MWENVKLEHNKREENCTEEKEYGIAVVVGLFLFQFISFYMHCLNLLLFVWMRCSITHTFLLIITHIRYRPFHTMHTWFSSWQMHILKILCELFVWFFCNKKEVRIADTFHMILKVIKQTNEWMNSIVTWSW